MGAAHLDLEEQLQAISGRGDCARHCPSRPARHKHPARSQHTGPSATSIMGHRPRHTWWTGSKHLTPSAVVACLPPPWAGRAAGVPCIALAPTSSHSVLRLDRSAYTATAVLSQVAAGRLPLITCSSYIFCSLLVNRLKQGPGTCAETRRPSGPGSSTCFVYLSAPGGPAAPHEKYSARCRGHPASQCCMTQAALPW